MTVGRRAFLDTGLTRYAGLSRTSPLNPCGKRYASEDEALAAAERLQDRSERPGVYEARACGLVSCGGWHSAYRMAASEWPARKVARDTGPDTATRRAVYKRDGWACVCCGTSIIGRPHSVGHRKRRSQGGGNGTANLLTFLGTGTDPFDPADHHARIDSRRNPADEDHGYTVRSGFDPGTVAVMYFGAGGSGFTACLDDGGGLLSLDGTVLYRAAGGDAP